MQRLGYGYSDNGTSPTLRSEPGDNQLAVAQPIAVDVYNQSIDGQTSATITEAVGGTNTSGPKVMQPIPINTMTMLGRPSDNKNPRMGLGIGNPGEPQNTLTKTHSHAVATGMAIRRLTPKECERLQGFPDDWTKIPYRNKEADQCPDGPRYKACGNSMAVPVMRWIGERINLIESML
jgi:DNA (cytosine-5)-methyltransferase 1